ncbi:hypothetical protein [Zhihengliuella sp.]|uniref:hypothetical protein n=1 Tax=Zhihengliuella sp. TaxID=1954483 RepID=UPI00281184A5|nr:hypothetical protein [Zhihengliuella sp.]
MGLLHELDGLKDGDGHYEIQSRQGGDYTLTYVVDRLGKRFPFVTPLREIEKWVQSRDNKLAAKQVGVSPIDMFTTRVNEIALTAPDHATALEFSAERTGWL